MDDKLRAVLNRTDGFHLQPGWCVRDHAEPGSFFQQKAEFDAAPDLQDANTFGARVRVGGAHWTVLSDFNPIKVSVRVGLEILGLVNDTYNAWIALVAKLGVIAVATID